MEGVVGVRSRLRIKHGRELQVTSSGSQRGSRSLDRTIVMIVIVIRVRNRAHAHG